MTNTMSNKALRITAIAAVAVLGLGLAACSSDDDSSSTTTEAGGGGGSKLVICSDIPYAPMEMEATDTKTPSGYTGFDIDLVQAIATGADKTLEVKVTPFDGIFAAMDAGTCDAVVSSVSITDERKQNMDFSEPYFDAEQSVMVTKANAEKYKTLADLTGQEIGVQSGTTGEEYVNSHKPSGSTVKALPGASDLFAALQSGTIAAVVQDYPINAYRTTQDKNFVITEKIPTEEQYGMAVKKGNTETLDLLNKGLSTAKSDGTYDKLYEKYFGEKPPTS
ncbi:MAG TPA: basic amino acid ABC transporter substrate-binding protein [Microthrixaceae bacterium]|nr:basic amino acid ABC transporter substrate-binding protein [Microthrixaceae bacterium]HNL49710.1 basic amino acid ABC transporter substrate-binding protein [Microthrixaceae bacterium]HPG15742.1 basic amino acid ABC transporter substrate-binding protein [Microthrixaceae bacterium]